MSDSTAVDVTPATGLPVPICRCGATSPSPTSPDRCRHGHVLLNNSAALRHGVYSFRDEGTAKLPADVRDSVADFKAQVVADRGGPSELSAIEAARIGHLSEVETVLRLLARDLSARGLTSARGRVRATVRTWFEALDRWQKLAGSVGDGRRARTLPSLQTYSNQPPGSEDR